MFVCAIELLREIKSNLANKTTRQFNTYSPCFSCSSMVRNLSKSVFVWLASSSYVARKDKRFIEKGLIDNEPIIWTPKESLTVRYTLIHQSGVSSTIFKKCLGSSLSWTKSWCQNNFKKSDWLFRELGTRKDNNTVFLRKIKTKKKKKPKPQKLVYSRGF